MLNIKNKYKAFQISFNPHTSLTAGLNIFSFFLLRKHFIQGGRGCIYTSKHANERVYWLPTRSPDYNTIKVHPYREEGENLKKKKNLTPIPKTIGWLVQSLFHRAGSVRTLDIDHSFKYGISKTLHDEKKTGHCSKRKTTGGQSFTPRASDFWCEWKKRKENKGILNSFFLINWGSNDKQKVIALFIFCLFQKTRSAREKRHALKSWSDN